MKKDVKNISKDNKDSRNSENFKGNSKDNKTIAIDTEFIRLQDLLKLAGLVPTGGAAKVDIQNGLALVNGEICLQRGRKLHAGDCVTFRGHTLTVSHAD